MVAGGVAAASFRPSCNAIHSIAQNVCEEAVGVSETEKGGDLVMMYGHKRTSNYERREYQPRNARTAKMTMKTATGHQLSPEACASQQNVPRRMATTVPAVASTGVTKVMRRNIKTTPKPPG